MSLHESRNALVADVIFNFEAVQWILQWNVPVDGSKFLDKL